MFPEIKHLNDLLPFIQDSSQIRVKPDDLTGHTVVCYMLQDEDTFSGAHEKYERECRGITFDEHGAISSRTMHKFFNIGEREDTMPDKIDWNTVDRVMDKRDGSMVTPVMMSSNNAFKFKTKKTFSSPEANLADTLAKSPKASAWIISMLARGFTPTFEITSPNFPIVLRYDQDELTLLHIRDNVSGKYLSEAEILDTAPPFKVVDNVAFKFHDELGNISWDTLKLYSETAENVEGIVIQFKNGDMMKLKTAWYISLHRAVTFTRWRDLARSVCADEADDLKAAFVMVGRSVEPILIVQRDIHSKIAIIKDYVESVAKQSIAEGKTAKDVALALRQDKYFSLIIRQFKGQEVDYMEYYIKNSLELDWGLEVVL